MNRLFLTAFWIAALTALVMANTAPVELPGNPNDKFLHVLVFAVLALLAVGAYLRTSLLKLWLGLTFLAALIEFLQVALMRGRDGDLVDLLVGIAAAAAVLFVVSAARRLRTAPTAR